MMFSSHIDMTYTKSALQDIFVKLLFIEYRLSKKIPLGWETDEWSHFIYSQTKANSKTSKVIASRCYAWSLGIKKSLDR